MSDPYISYSDAKTMGAFIKTITDEYIELFVRKDLSFQTLLEFQRVYKKPIKQHQLSHEEFESKLNDQFTEKSATGKFAADLEVDLDLSQLVHDFPQVDDLLEVEGDAPIIRMMNVIFAQAIRDSASDIHIEPYETKSLVRFRIDGTLRTIVELHRALHAALISRIKVMAQLDIAEKRLPQDGRITVKIAGKVVDIRLSTLPTGHGERAVLRLLEKDGGKLELSQLGMSTEIQKVVDRVIHQPHGIFLVTGPTGSGKSTTLYSAVKRLDHNKLNIMTVEDPIEYDIPNIAQTQVNPKIDMSFAKALRAILRQDPDVVMIGEIRDIETAQIAVQSSLTGHLVLATLHTNDSVSALTRLIDMEIEPFLLSSSLSAVLAQRLVRRLCNECKVSYKPSQSELDQLISKNKVTLYKPIGCPACGGIGYSGRVGIYELMIVDDEMRKLIHENMAEHHIRAHAKSKGMRELKEDGMRLVESGITSLEEVMAVTKE
mgnify:CR=1 FL=1